MFWKKKIKLPITKEDQEWIDQDIDWLRNLIVKEDFLKIRTITPTKNFYNRTFDGSENDAYFILKRTKELMKIRSSNIQLQFFSDSPVEMSDGNILSSPADINGNWNSASGIYEQSEDNKIISIETRQLKDTVSLIATISHELAHIFLLDEKNTNEDNEFLTDLTAIVFGFGIFLGNSKFKYSAFTNSSGSGWEMSNQGYLPEQIIGYSMAKLSILRKENIKYVEFLNSSMKKYFEKSYKYLNQI